MTEPRDTASAFDRIGAEVGYLLTLLGEAASGDAMLTVRDKITALLNDAGLNWQDLAEHVVAPNSEGLTAEDFIAKHVGAASPQSAPSAPVLPPDAVLSDEDLKGYGYRRAPETPFGHSEGPKLDKDTETEGSA